MSKQSELSDILSDFADGVAAEEAWVDAEQAILDWHNKQVEQAYSDGFKKASKGAFRSQQEAKREAVEAVLDRLLEHGEDFTTFGDGSRSVAVEYIEAERKRLTDTNVGKLKESTDDV